MCVVVCECQEAVTIVELGFVFDPCCPLFRVVYLASHALAAWEFEFVRDVVSLELGKDNATAGGGVGL